MIEQIISSGIIAIVRSQQSVHIPHIVNALSSGGIKFIEITSNTPDALYWIKKISHEIDDGAFLGAGTILNSEMAREYIEAGAKFLVTPFTKKEIIEEAHRHEVPVVSGAMTPGEIALAHEAGADMIKVFPAEFFGPKYIKAIKAPMDYVKLAPTGGVSLSNVEEWIKAGADALGIGSALFNDKILAKKDYRAIIRNAEAMVNKVREAREV